ncbi:Hypothetical protein A7982_00029 [Minicystis rosea]|nr:Hypothetical protein A7982_00029 [Minicystis rosea]
MDLDAGGYPRQSLPVGFIGRSHLDSGSRAGLATIRLDTLALLAIAGNVRGPLVLEGIGGLTFVPRWMSNAYKTVDRFAAVGPSTGLRVRAIAPRPWIGTELELLYTPLFGRPVSGRLHHVGATSALTFSPLAEKWRPVSFELRGHLEWAWSSDVVGGRPDASLLAGVRIRYGSTEDKPTTRAR